MASSPWPMASGEPRRAPIRRPAWPAKMMASAKAPSSCASVAAVACLRVEAAFHVGIDQVGDHLGIGVGDELAPLRLQLGPELAVVLDDAVVDHGDAAGGVRVGVGFAGLAMRGPAGVPDANCAADGAPGDQAFELDELALGAAKLDQAVGERRETGRIVAAVFEAPQPVEDVRRRLIRARDADDSAHSSGTPLLRAA